MATKEFRDVLEVEGINAWGYGNISKMVMKDKDLTQIAKLIYSYLCSYAGGGSCPFPSVDTICADLDMQDDTYFKHLKYLVAYGYIKKEQKRISGKFTSNRYKLVINPVPVPELLEKLKIKEKKKIKKVVKIPSKKPAKSENKVLSPYPVSSGTVTRDTVKQGTNNNNILNNNNTSLITTTESVVVPDEEVINNTKKQIDDTLQGNIDQDAVKNLIKNYGIERIKYTIDNWEGIVGNQNIQSSAEGFFKRAVENAWKPGSKKSKTSSNRKNFDEREYPQEYYDNFFNNQACDTAGK